MFLPWLATTEVVTMKMISRTRKTSVSGVMLISATTLSSPLSSAGRNDVATGGLRCRQGLARRLDVQERLHEALAGARVGRRERADADLQAGVEGPRRDRDEETGRGRA